jgi:hypothetical protein
MREGDRISRRFVGLALVGGKHGTGTFQTAR